MLVPLIEPRHPYSDEEHASALHVIECVYEAHYGSSDYASLDLKRFDLG
jgi:hypothetical protein